MPRWTLWLWTLLSLWLVAPIAHAADENCANPRVAADSLFIHLRPGSYDPALAKQCMDVPPGASGEALAVRLKQVLDARGHWVPVSSLSTDPDYLDESGTAQVVPMPEEFPVLKLERAADGRWLYSQDTLSQVDGLYRQTFSPISLAFQSQLPAIFYNRIFGFHLWQFLYAALLLLVAVVLGQLAHMLLRTQVRSLVRRAGLQMDATTYARTNGPISAAVVVGVLLWGVPDLQLSIRASSFLLSVGGIAVTLAVATVVSRFVDVIGDVSLSWAKHTESKLDDQLIPLLEQAARVLVIVVTVLFVLDALGIDVWKLAAGVGIGGLAFALAAQDTVANVFGSVNIFIDKPFQIGDWVIIGKVEGVIEEVGFRSTRVRTFYNSVVTIPNSSITNSNVDNMGLRPRRRAKFSIGLTYNTPPDKVQAYVEGVRAILAAHPDVERTYEVHLYNLGDSSIDILVYYHLKVAGWHEELLARSQNIQEFMRLADALGVSFAFPSTSVYVESTPDKPLQPQATPGIEMLQQTADSFGPGGDVARPRGAPFEKSWTVKAREWRKTNGSANAGPHGETS